MEKSRSVPGIWSYEIQEFVIIVLFFPGVKGVQVEEIWSLDPDSFTNLR